MSITFFSPESPSELKDSFKCVYCEGLKEPNPACNACKGTGTQSYYDHTNSINFSESSAKAILRLLGQNIADDCYGGWEPEELGTIRQRILLLLNSSQKRAGGIVPYSEEKAERGAMFIECGCTDEQLLRKLRRLDGILFQAQQNSWQVVWT